MMSSDRSFYIKLVAICYPVWIILFVSSGLTTSTLPPVNANLEVDSLIPFIPGFVWVYVSCYVMPLFLVLIAKNWHRFNVVLLSLAIAHVVAFAVYLNLPVSVQKPGTGYSVSGIILSVLYSWGVEPWTNNLPSLHVIFAFTIATGSLGQSLGRPVEIVTFIWATFIAASTLLVRQHIVLDVASGLLTMAGTWALAGFLYRRYVVVSQDARSSLNQLTKRIGPWLLFSVALMLSLTAIHWMLLKPHG